MFEDDVGEKTRETETELGQVRHGVAAIGEKTCLHHPEALVVRRTTDSVPPGDSDGARDSTTETNDDAVLLFGHHVFCSLPQCERLEVLCVLQTVLQEPDAVVSLRGRGLPADPVVEPSDSVSCTSVATPTEQSRLLYHRRLLRVLIQLLGHHRHPVGHHGGGSRDRRGRGRRRNRERCGKTSAVLFVVFSFGFWLTVGLSVGRGAFKEGGEGDVGAGGGEGGGGGGRRGKGTRSSLFFVVVVVVFQSLFSP